MTSLEKAINSRYIYLTLKPKLLKIKTYQYEHHFLMLVLIYFNLFRENNWIKYIYRKSSPFNGHLW